MKKSVLNTFAFNRTYAGMLVADLSDAQMTAQPGPGMNHPAWVLGHLATTVDFGLELLGQKHALGEDWHAKFGNGSPPTADGDYPDKDTLLETLDAQHARFAAAFDGADQAALDAVMPLEDFRQLMPTVGDAMVFIATAHETTHLGQLSAWRRVQGLPSVIG